MVKGTIEAGFDVGYEGAEYEMEESGNAKICPANYHS